MRTETILKTYYQFSELPEDVKQKVIENNYDINIFSDWYEYTFEDAKSIGLKIDTFDTYHKNINGNFIVSACEVAQNIFNNHGEECETYKTAETFMNVWQPIFNEYMDQSSPYYESGKHEDMLLELESEFLNSLLEDYLIILQKEYEYLTGSDAIIETIEANEYEFDINGKIQ